jgi:hypothetical protein
MVLVKLFDDHVLDDVRSIYKAVNALLVQNSILPKIRYCRADRTTRRRRRQAGRWRARAATPGLLHPAGASPAASRTSSRCCRTCSP